MLIVIHVIIAVAGLAATGLAWLHPSLTKIHVAMGLVGLTLASGTLLVVMSRPAHLTQTCLTGLAYLAVTVAGIVAARHKLLAEESE